VSLQLESNFASTAVATIIFELWEVAFAFAETVAELSRLAGSHNAELSFLLSVRRTGDTIAIVEP
jgi:hypothetical protein